MQHEIKEMIIDQTFFKDHHTQVSETDIYQLSNCQVISDIDVVDEDGAETAFKEVVNFYKEKKSGKYMPKFCSFKMFQHDEDEVAT